MVRKDKIHIDPDLLRRLYRECDGWIQRVHEKLVEEEGIQVSYPTLTRLLRDLELGKSRKVRCDRVPDEPGVEMQHDTTVYQVKLAGQRPAFYCRRSIAVIGATSFHSRSWWQNCTRRWPIIRRRR